MTEERGMVPEKIGTEDVIQGIDRQIQEFLAQVGVPEVVTAEDVVIVDGLRKKIRVEKAAVEAKLNPFKEAAYKSWQGWTELIRQRLSRLDALETEIVKRVKAWKAKEDQRIADELARQREQRNQEIVAARKRADEIRAKADANADERLQAAAELERLGLVSEARAVLDSATKAVDTANETAQQVEMAPLVQPMPKLAKPAVKLDGRTYRTTYHAEVVDFMALVQAVANGTVGPYVLSANMAELKRLAQMATGDDVCPGVKRVKD